MNSPHDPKQPFQDAAPSTPRAANLLKNRREFETGQVKLESLPTVLFVELTQNCNLECRMCRASDGYQRSLNMTDELFDLLRTTLFSTASIVDLRGWGESTILKSLGRRVEETVAAGPMLRLVTNALAISPSLWDLLMSVGASVVVSVDAASPGTMERLGRGSFERLITSLNAGRVARERYSNRGSISFNTVVTGLSLDELPDIVELAVRFDVAKVTMFPVVAKRTSPLHLDARKAEIRGVVEDAEAKARTHGIELRHGASLHEEVVVEYGLPDRCSHPWEYCYIDYAGNVGYCDHLIGNTSLTLGSLKTSSFEEIWNGSEFRKLRELHTRVRHCGIGAVESSFPHCAWCYERRYVDFEEQTNRLASSRIVSTTRHPCPSLGLPPGPFIRRDFMSGRDLPIAQSAGLGSPATDSPPARSTPNRA